MNQDTKALVLDLWAEQLVFGLGEPGEVVSLAGLDDWISNRTYPVEVLEAAAAGDVAALIEVRQEAGLPILT